MSRALSAASLAIVAPQTTAPKKRGGEREKQKKSLKRGFCTTKQKGGTKKGGTKKSGEGGAANETLVLHLFFGKRDLLRM